MSQDVQTEQRRARSPNLTADEVAIAMETLTQRGDRVSVRAIYEELGRGSLATISRLRREVEARSDQNTLAAGGTDVLLASLRAQVRREMQAEFDDALAGADETLAAAKAMREKSEAKIEAMREDLDRAHSAIETLNHQCGEWQEACATQRTHAQHWEARCNEAEKRAEAMAARWDDLMRRLEALEAATKERDAGQGRAEEAVDRAMSVLDERTAKIARDMMSGLGGVSDSLSGVVKRQSDLSSDVAGMRSVQRTIASRLDEMVDGDAEREQAQASCITELSDALTGLIKQVSTQEELVSEVAGQTKRVSLLLPQTLELLSDLQEQLAGLARSQEKALKDLKRDQAARQEKENPHHEKS